MNIRCDPELDALYIEYLRAKIDRAEAAITEGRILSHEEVIRRSQQWFEQSHPRRPCTPTDP